MQPPDLRDRTIPRWAPVVSVVFVVGAALGIVLALLLTGQGTRSGAVDAAPALERIAAKQKTAHLRSPRGGEPGQTGVRALESPSPLVPAAAAASFSSLKRRLPGAVGLAVGPLGDGPTRTFGTLQTGHAWSTMKVPVLVAYLRGLEEDGATLSAADRRDATLAIEQSDNAAISAIFARLEELYGGLVPASRTIEGLLRLAGDDATHVNTASNDQGFSTFGQTQWSPSGSVSFYRALADGCLMRPEDTRYVLRLMETVTPSERWGAGQAGFSAGLSLAFKGGWGPQATGSYLVRQDVIVGTGGRGYVLSIIAAPRGTGYESFTVGQRMLTETASWARRTFNLRAIQGTGKCQA